MSIVDFNSKGLISLLEKLNSKEKICVLIDDFNINLMKTKI